MKLVFDTETTGRPDMRSAPDAPHHPRIVQLGFALYDEDGRECAAVNAPILPDGWSVPAEVIPIHGFSTERLRMFGIPLAAALSTFASYLPVASELIAHNIDFDLFILTGELLRLGEAVDALSVPTRVCTMRESTDLCRLPGGRRGWKWPSLTEAYRHFYERDFEGAHDAMADVRACAAVHFALIGKPFAFNEAPVPPLAAGSDRLSNGFTWQDLAECAKREVRQRRRVYPKLVLEGSMESSTATRETDMMRTIGRVLENMTVAELPLN